MCEQRGTAFALSRVISAHSEDVKSIFATPAGLLVSGGRDGAVKIFSERAGDYSEALSMKQPKKLAVNAVAFHQSATGWLVFVGCMDGSIAVFSSGSAEPIRTLHKHTKNVCVLHVDSVSGKLISGSWDSSAIVWQIGDLTGSDSFTALVLVGHKMAVWAAASIPDRPNGYLTGSADMTIKLWNGDCVVSTFTGHEDVVRCIVVLSPTKFVSGSNDFTLRLWDLDAAVCLRKYISLACEFIFGMAIVDNAAERILANCGEDGFIELWALSSEHHLSHKQFMRTPAQTAWSIAALNNGDIAVGANDGNIYVFTRNEKRKASRVDLEAFDASVAKKVSEAAALTVAQQQEVVKIKVALGEGEPDMELRYTKGSDPIEAAEAFVKENGMPLSFVDEITEYIKANVPEARIASRKKAARMQPRQRVIVDGQEWDYVFDVTTEDGRVLKLPYNVGEDMNWAAQRFVEKYKLPIQFLQKVSGLLRMQIPEAPTTAKSCVAFVDPYTGDGRYIPGSVSSSGVIANAGADPFTGEGRYVPAQNDVANPVQRGSAFTAGDDKMRPRGEFIPLTDYFRFGFERVSPKAIAKLKEMNELQLDHRLTDQQLIAVEAILRNSSYEPSDVHITAIDTGLLWTSDAIVPIMDAFRLALLNRRFNEIYCGVKTERETGSRGMNTLQKLIAVLTNAVSDPVRILACRAIANAAVHRWGREMLMNGLNDSLAVVISQLSSRKEALQLAAASAVANWSLLLLRHSESSAADESSLRRDMTKTLVKYLKMTESFGGYSEATKIRILQALATVMWGDIAVIKVAKEADVVGTVNRVKDALVAECGKAIARDIVGMAYAV